MNPLKKVNLGSRLLALGQVDEAAQLSSKLLAEASEVAEVHALAYEVALARNQITQAIAHINRAVELDSDQPDLQFKKADIETISRQGLKAQETASAVASRFPGDPMIQMRAARVFSQCGNHAGAEPFLLKAGAKRSKHPAILFDFSTNQFFLGKTAEAEEAISRYLDLRPPAKGGKWLLRSQLQKQTPGQNHVEMLRNCLSQPLTKKEAVYIYFALAKELEDLGEYKQSFSALKTGAAFKRQLVRFDLSEELANMKNVLSAFQPANFAGIPDSGSRDSPIFIVGMPRTGTTLVERMVSKGEGIRSAEETYDFTLAFSSVINSYIAANPDRHLNPLSAALEVDYGEIADKYLNNMRGMFGKAARYMDKTPFNFLYCGLIKKAFPNARILHLIRDPMDTCYAVFKTLFARAYYFSYDLDELADYYIAYRQLMDHWHQLMPGAILDVRYEELVSKPLDVSRRIADYVGFTWSSELIEVQNITAQSSTASAAQVREPIYTTSVSRWRHLETELEPVRRKLTAANMVDDSGNSLV
jgi:tetratricopeptide (TPR) repeat protein